MSIDLGNIDPYTDYDYLITSMREWVSKIDKQLDDEYQLNGYSSEFNKIWQSRIVTFEEFQDLFKDVSEEKFHKYKSFVYFDIRNTSKLESFKFNHQNDKVSYAAMILAHATPALDFFLRRMQAIMPKGYLDFHTLIVSKTRSGKSTLMQWILFNAIKRKSSQESFLIIDPHGKFAKELRRLKLLVEQIDNVVYLDLANYDHVVPSLNIFQQDDKRERALSAATGFILDAFDSLTEDFENTGNMRRVFRHCAYATLYMDNTDLLSLQRLVQGLLKTKKNESKKLYELSEEEITLLDGALKSPNESTRDFFATEWRTVDAKTLEALINRIDDLMTDSYVRAFLTGKSTFNLKKMLNSGKIVIVNIDFGKLHKSSKTVGRVFTAACYNALQSRLDMPEESQRKTRLVIDEIENFQGEDVNRLLSQLGKYGVGLMAAHQLPEQLDSVTFKTFLSNTYTKIFGANSVDVANTMAGEMKVEAKVLAATPKYHFHLNIDGKHKGMFKASEAILDPNLYISEAEARIQVDQYMIDVKKYYKPVDMGNRTKSASSEESDEREYPLDDTEFHG